ncbi:hypothetical protein [Streptomyces chrestomyceticus]|uniref:hypothetical protein n=1 Tax=Streptomyces chrestomyceticus TaxID=68185 RepID=UPI0012B900CF
MDTATNASRIRPRTESSGTTKTLPYRISSASQLHQGTRRRCPMTSHSSVPSSTDAV